MTEHHETVHPSPESLLRSWPKRLNDGLSVRRFKIFVPETCFIPGFGVMNDGFPWEDYLDAISDDAPSNKPLPYQPDDDEKSKPEKKSTGGRPGAKAWFLRGERALRHALYVHRLFATEFLKLPGVSAVDIGFAIEESNRQFENILCLRIHVSEKRSPALLHHRGVADLTNLGYLIASLADTHARQPTCTSSANNTAASLPVSIWQDYRHLVYDFPLLPEGMESPQDKGQIDEALKFLGDEQRWAQFRYPVLGVGNGDLGLYCSSQGSDTRGRTTDLKARLTVCGVPLDILGAMYQPSVVTSRRQGVFVGQRRTTSELTADEQVKTSRSRTDPLVGGVSISSASDQTGTAAAVVWDRTDGTPCLLSNWHVLAGDSTARAGQPCIQPSRFDGGDSGDTVAHLKRWYLGVKGDAALAEVNGSRQYASGEILGMRRPLAGSHEPRLNLEIRKWGRTTGFTRGFIDGIQMTVDIQYQTGSSRRFDNQMHIAPLYLGESVSQPGDSGAMAVMSYSPEDMSQRLVSYEELMGEGVDIEDENPGTFIKWLKEFYDDAKARRDVRSMEINNQQTWKVDWLKIVEEALKYARAEPEAISKIAKAAADLAEEEEEEKKRGIEKELISVPDSLDLDIGSLRRMAEKEEEEKLVSTLESLDLNIGRLREMVKDNVSEEEKENVEARLISELESFAHEIIDSPETAERTEREKDNKKKQLARVLKSFGVDEMPQIAKKGRLISAVRSFDRANEVAQRGEDEIDTLSLVLESLNLDIRSLRRTTENLRKATESLQETARSSQKTAKKQEQGALRTYFAVGLLFAGDTPGSPLGEFAIASSIRDLEEELQFSLRPVFPPRTSFREVLIDGRNGHGTVTPDPASGNKGFAPVGLGSATEGTGSTTDPETRNTGGGT